MEDNRTHFGFSVVDEHPQKQRATVIIGEQYVHALYHEALISRKKVVKTHGFAKGTTPLHYIEQNFRTHILEHLKELLFTHCVVHLLYDSMATKKLLTIGDPDLIDIKLQPDGNAEFVFQLINVNFDNEQRWKRLHLKPLTRKHYKDLDRQVENFIKEEEMLHKKFGNNSAIELEDWVNFEVSLLDAEKNDLIPGYKSDLWVRLQSGEDDKDLQQVFLGKKVGDRFISESVFLQEYISPASDIEYSFQVEIKNRIPHSHFSLDLFKVHFGLIDDSEIPHRLIEVFSTRNDITLRRETVEAVFKLLHKQYYLALPQRLLERQKRLVLEAVQNTPDYHVYKARDDFNASIKALAEKQLKEAILIDAIAYQEGITVDNDDISAYLSLLTRARTKNFVYFGIPEPKNQGHEIPLSTALIKRYCLREKTLNHVIKMITQKAA